MRPLPSGRFRRGNLARPSPEVFESIANAGYNEGGKLIPLSSSSPSSPESAQGLAWIWILHAPIRRPIGHVEITELTGHELRLPDGELVAKRFLYTWQPPDQLLSKLPPWYRFGLGVHRSDQTECVDSRLSNYRASIQRDTSQVCDMYPRRVALHLSHRSGAVRFLPAKVKCKAGQLLNYHEARLFLQYIHIAASTSAEQGG